MACQALSQTIPNSWEMLYLGNLSHAATDDPGGVGRTLLQSYQQGLSPWPAPVVASGLQAWYRADEGVVADGSGNVSQWSDLSGSGYHVYQAQTALEPQLISNVMNGNPVMQFGASGGQILTTPVVEDLEGSGNGDMTIIVVMSPGATQSGPTAILNFGLTTGGWNLGLIGNGNDQWGLVLPTSSGGQQQCQAPALTASEVQVVSEEASGTNSNVYVNGALAASGTIAGSAPPFTGALAVGNVIQYPNAYNGRIAEILVYNRALSDSERQSIEAALKAKYIAVDANGNGIPDSWEMQYIGNLSHAATDDPGGVGRTLLQSYQQGLSPWPVPVVASGLQAWYRADKGVVADGSGNVSQWSDLSGSGYHVYQAQTGLEPQLISNVMNGNPVMQFGASGGQILTTPVLENLEGSGNGDMTIMVVMNPGVTQSGPTAILNFGLTTGGWNLGLIGNGYDQWGLVLPTSGGGQQQCQAPTLTASEVQVVSEEASGTNSNVYVNGALAASGTIAGSAPPFTGALAVGNVIQYPNAYNGQIAEILVYNRALTDVERQSIEAALTAKYMPAETNGIPNSWLMQYLGTLSYSASADPGGVGRTLLQSYQQGLSPWPAPVVASGLQAWYRADKGVVADGSGNVSQWSDLSGSGYHVYQAQTALEPQLISNVMNGNPVMQFGASGSQILTTPVLENLEGSGNGDMTIIVVMNPGATQSGPTAILNFGLTTGGWNLGLIGNGSDQWGLVLPTSGGGQQQCQSPTLTASEVQVVSEEASGTNSNVYVNGALAASGTIAGSAPAFTGALAVGNVIQYPNAYNGQIAEVLVYNRALTDAERQSIEAALKAKYIAVDANGNGIPDSWEMLYLGNLSHAATDDPGGVGRTLLQSYQQGLSPWPAPVVASGLQAWYRADKGVVADGSGNVSQWSDLSGSGYHVYQAQTGLEPQLVSNVMNGNPVMQFGASGAQILTTPVLEDIEGSGNGDMTMIVVMSPGAAQSGPTAILNFGLTTSGWNLGLIGGGNNQWGLVLPTSSGGQQQCQAPTLTASEVQVVSEEASGTNSNVYVNGALAASGTIAGSAPPFTGTLAVGNVIQYPNAYNGQIAEILVYNRALSDAERQSIEAALKAKYVNPDSNGNGIPDSWEMQYLGNLTHAATDDPGGVGRTLLQSYQQGLSPWPAPVVASGLQAWYRADMGVIADSNNNVTQWTDLSGTGATVLQSNSGMAPQLALGAVNGHPAIQFNGSSSNMVTPGQVDLFNGSNDVSVIVVLVPGATQEPSSVLFNGSGTSLRVSQDNTSTNQYDLLWVDSSNNEYASSDVTTAAGVPQVLDLEKSGTELNGYLNGTLQSDTSIWWTSQADLQQGPQSWTIGGMATAFYNGQIAEILVYNRALSDADRQSIVAALMAKYVSSPPSITSPTTATASAGTAFSYQITANNSPISYNATGLPFGFTINATTGLITGTPSSTGIYSITAYATNADGTTSINVTVSVTAPLPTGEILWLRADEGVVTDSNGNVSTWEDQSGHGNNATQSSSNVRPTVAANALNDLPAVQFSNASGQFFNLPSALMTAATQGEAFIVVKATSATPSNARGLWHLGANITDYPNFDLNIYDSFGSSVAYDVGTPPSGVANYGIYNVSAQAGLWTARVDGVTLFKSTTNTVSFGSNPVLGSNGSQSFDGEIAEVIIYNSVLSAAQRAAVGEYLESKYNLPGIAVPANPSNLIAAAISGTETSLVWSDTPTTTGITYTVWRQNGAGGYTAIAQVNNSLSFVDSGLTPGTTYSYEISSNTLAGSSPGFSNSVNVAMPASGTDMPLTGINLWLKADSGVEAAASGSISQWLDQSGNGNNALQLPVNNVVVLSNQPTVTPNALNGRPAIQFSEASNQWFNLPSTLMNGATQGEVFVALKAATASPSNARGLWRLGSGAADYPSFDLNIYDSFGSSVAHDVGTPPSGVANYSLYDVSAQAGQWTARVDGVTLFSTPANTVSFASNPLLGSNGSQTFDGAIAEIIIYNSVLTPAQRAAVGQYFAGKYSLPLIAAPANPTNLNVTPISGTETSLVWSDVPTTTGITYTVWRQNGSGGYAAVAQVNNSLSYVDSGLTPGANYSYEISSSTLAGSSPGFSNSDNVTTPASGTDMPLAGMRLWLKADSGVEAAPSGSVSQWLDQSGNGNNALQLPVNNVVTIANQPTVTLNALNGRPVIQFSEASNQWFNLPSTLMNGATQGEVFVVVKAATASPSNVRGLWHFGANGGGYPNFDQNIYDSFGSSVLNEVGTPESLVSNYSIFNVSSQAGQWVARVNGETLVSSAINTVAFASNPLLGSNGSQAFDGQIAEIIIYSNVLTSAQRAAVGQYLIGKYNLSGITLPANPTNLIATPISGTEVSLVWSDPSPTMGTTYTIWRQSGSGSNVAIAQANNALSYMDSGLAPGTSYSYEVSSSTLAGASPGFSNGVVATTLSSGTDVPLTGMNLWLKADSGVLSSPGDGVSKWLDQSGNSNNALQLLVINSITASNQPTQTASAVNGRPVMQFTAANSQWFNLPSTLMSGATQGEVFVVAKATSSVPANNRGLWHLGSSGGYYPNLDQNIYECFGSSTQYKVGIPASSVTNYSIYDVSAQSGQFAAQFNGVTLFSSATNTVSFATNPELGSNGVNAFDGEIAEVIIYNNVLTAQQRAIVEWYLQSKYNLQTGASSGSTDGIPNTWLLEYFGTTAVNPNYDFINNGQTVAQDYAAGVSPVDYYNGRPFAVVPSGLANTYSYDLSGRLAKASYSNGVNVQFTSDAASNVTNVANYGPIVQWRMANNLPPDGTGTGADSAVLANDGVPNLVKYALGLAPQAVAPTDTPIVSLSSISGGYVTLTYTRPDPAPSDLIYTVRVSADGVNWSSGVGATTGVSTAVSDGIATVVVRDNVAVTAPATIRYIQLGIQRIPQP
jgi:Concanavalin A-like lectin/glucanases superfamily/Fibronectin type III domain